MNEDSRVKMTAEEAARLFRKAIIDDSDPIERLTEEEIRQCLDRMSRLKPPKLEYMWVSLKPPVPPEDDIFYKHWQWRRMQLLDDMKFGVIRVEHGNYPSEIRLNQWQKLIRWVKRLFRKGA